MKKLILGMLVIGFTSQVFPQVITLPEIEITAVNYKYINAVDSENLDFDVKKLEEKVANFDLKNSDIYLDEFYLDEYKTYNVRFYIPKGKIVAAYDGNGKITRTIEKFTNITLPAEVRDAIFTRFPEWVMKKNIYRVTYNQDNCRKEYKIVLKKGNEIIRFSTDEKGNLIEESHLK